MRKLWFGIILVFGNSLAASAAPIDAQQLAERIDFHLKARRQDAKAEPAPRADDAEFLRRIYLDIAGRIPRPNDVYRFLADKDPDKRKRTIDDLLDSPRHANHFANLWRAQLIAEVAASDEAHYFQTGFEAWLRQNFRANAPYDHMVRELLTTPIAGIKHTPESVFRNAEKPNPLAFFAVKDARPENLAATATRLFLGIQIDCAQCHNHPFASWTREQFWNQAAFFAGIERQGEGIFAPLTEAAEVREFKPDALKHAVRPVFLDGKEPNRQTTTGSRQALADWITSKDNPYFARASVNRLWGNFFGRGIVEPVDDFNDENAPSHPELLDELAQAFAAGNFDNRLIIRAICMSQAYQQTSRRTHTSQDDPRLFARMAVKGLTGEQFFDSLALAVGYRERTSDRGAFGRETSTVRSRFLRQFAPQGRLSEPETSILQALILMNGKFLNEATTLDKSPTLQAIDGIPGADTSAKIEALYLVTLSRKPTDAERGRLLKFIRQDTTDHETQRLSDVFWVLLNSAEFRLNH